MGVYYLQISQISHLEIYNVAFEAKNSLARLQTTFDTT